MPEFPVEPRGSHERSGDILLHKPLMKRHVLIFGLVGGLLIATLQYTEYRFVTIEHSVELSQRSMKDRRASS